MNPLNNIRTNFADMLILDFPANDVGTTFDRYSMEVSLSNPLTTTLYEEQEPLGLFKGLNSRKEIPVYTNLQIEQPRQYFKTVYAQLTINEEALSDDFDFYIPLKPKKSFKLRVKVKSVSKFKPKAFFD